MKSLIRTKSLIQAIAGAACSAALLAAGAAHAHYLWIEPGDGGARLYYGEADALLKEKSPGRLDNIKEPQAFVLNAAIDKPTAAATIRTAEYFSIAAGKETSAILVAEESLEPSDLTRHGLGIAKSNYYARYGQPGASSHAGEGPLVLDVQGREPNAFSVLYRGQPLKNAKLEVIAPNTWVQEHKTNAEGVVEINTPWRGRYVVHVLHVDKAPGEFAGKKYENSRNHFTYTFINKDGADPGPAVPPGHEMD